MTDRLRHLLNAAGLLVAALCIAVTPASATVLKLSSQTNAHGNVLEFQISPDGQYVVYKADRLNDGSDEIYSVPITGGTPVRLNVDPEPPFQVGLYAISPDSRWVVYIVPPQSGQGFATPADLFRVPIAGGTSVKLNGPLVAGRGVWSFTISPDSTRVVYRADQEADNVFELYSVPLDASAPPVKLNKTLVAGGDVSAVFRVTPDSRRVIYIADQDTNDVDELYSVPLGGPAADGIKLNPPLVSGGNVGYPPANAYFSLSPDGTRVVYYVDQETDGRFELFSASVSTAASGVKLNVELTSGNMILNSDRISPDSSHVLYTTNTASPRGVYRVPITGPASASALLIPDGWGGSFSTDGNTVVGYRPDGPSTYTILAVPANGPVSSTVILATGVRAYQFIGGRHVVYAVTVDGGPAVNVYSVPITGPATAAVQLNQVLVAGDLGYRISPDGRRLVYQSSNQGGNPSELFSVPITGPYTDSVKISGPMVSGGNVEYVGFNFSPDGRRVVYRADAETDGKIELYVTDEGNLVNNRVYLPLIVH
ncbi:MAG: hypothetical protein NZM11_01650 [Anaerolineales bacterium]|nr:hypothetical protein [Anaerolineales bacterium]